MTDETRDGFGLTSRRTVVAGGLALGLTLAGCGSGSGADPRAPRTARRRSAAVGASIRMVGAGSAENFPGPKQFSVIDLARSLQVYEQRVHGLG